MVFKSKTVAIHKIKVKFPVSSHGAMPETLVGLNGVQLIYNNNGYQGQGQFEFEEEALAKAVALIVKRANSSAEVTIQKESKTIQEAGVF